MSFWFTAESYYTTIILIICVTVAIVHILNLTIVSSKQYSFVLCSSFLYPAVLISPLFELCCLVIPRYTKLKHTDHFYLKKKIEFNRVYKVIWNKGRYLSYIFNCRHSLILIGHRWSLYYPLLSPFNVWWMPIQKTRHSF